MFGESMMLKWFISDTRNGLVRRQGRIRICTRTEFLSRTRTPALLGPGVVQEVFVRIFSEHEAVKLTSLVSRAKGPDGGKQSAVFNQARIIVKGCGNSPTPRSVLRVVCSVAVTGTGICRRRRGNR
jgi:hypothetical protein